MRRFPSLTGGPSDLLLFISGLAIVGYLLIVAPVSRPSMVSNAGNVPVVVMTAASKHTTMQDELWTPLQQEPKPLSRRLGNDLRWYLLATAPLRATGIHRRSRPKRSPTRPPLTRIVRWSSQPAVP